MFDERAWSRRIVERVGTVPRVIRTSFFDDFPLDSCRRSGGVRQVVFAAASLDTRAFRLDWTL